MNSKESSQEQSPIFPPEEVPSNLETVLLSQSKRENEFPFSKENTSPEELWNQEETLLSLPPKSPHISISTTKPLEDDFKTKDYSLTSPSSSLEAFVQTTSYSEWGQKKENLFQKQFGKYEVLSKLGEGGMGLIFKVRHCELKTIYALKVMLAGEHASEESIQRFHREARTVAKLRHPGIVQVFDSGEEKGVHYFVMEYVEGETLEDRIKNGISFREGLFLIQKSLEALYYSHTQNILHRDLKPANIFVTKEGLPKIGDFGLAKDVSLESEAQKLTHSGIVLGTPAFMPPEQAMGDIKQMDGRTDVYSMGASLYQMLTSKMVHEAPTLHMMIYKILYEEITPPSKINEHVHQDIDTIVLKALEKKKEKRYENAFEFAEDIRRFLEGYPIKAKPISITEKAVKWVKRNRFVFGFSLCTLFFIFILLSYVRWNFVQKQQQQIHVLLEQADEEEGKAQKISSSEKKELGSKIQHLLNALKYLDQANSVLPHPFEIRNRKKILQETLVPLVCSTGDYQLADYLVSTIETLSEEEKTKQKELFQMIDEKRNNLLKQHKTRLKEWITQLTQNDLNAQMHENALFEISKMAEEEIFQEIVAILQNSAPYFQTSSNKNHRLNRYYLTMARVLGRLENPQAKPVLMRILQQLSEKLSVMAFPPFEEIEFMVALSEALVLSHSSEVSYFLGEIRRKMGRNSTFWELTTPVYENLVQRENLIGKTATSAMEYYQRALFFGDKKDYSHAIEDCTEAIRLDPKYVDAYLQRGEMQENLKNYKNAFDDYNNAIRCAPTEAKAYNYRGSLKFERQEYESALEDFEKAVQFKPQEFKGFHNRGNAKLQLGDLQGAFEDYTQALKLNPQHINSYLMRGEIRVQQGQYKDAIHLDYNIAREIHPRNPHIHFFRGIAGFNQKNYYEAATDFQRTLELNPEYPDAYLRSGMAKREQSEYEGSLLDFNQAIFTNPQDFRGYLERGLLKMNANSKETQKESIEDFQKAIALESQCFGAYHNLATVYYNLSQKDKAIETYIQGLEIQDHVESKKRLLILLFDWSQEKIRLKEYVLAKKYLLLFQKYASLSHPQYGKVEKWLKQLEKY